jgi:hypothetical protein
MPRFRLVLGWLLAVFGGNVLILSVALALLHGPRTMWMVGLLIAMIGIGAGVTILTQASKKV